MEKTKIKILMNNKVKTVYRDAWLKVFFVKDNHNLLECDWADGVDDAMVVDTYGIAPVVQYEVCAWHKNIEA